MQKGHLLQLCCPECDESVPFSLFDIVKKEPRITCSGCGLCLDFSDPDLLRQLQKFEALCLQLKASEEILSNTSVGIHIGEKEIKIPYKLLLTRLNSVLDLHLGDRALTIRFRIEPLADIALETH